MKIKTTLLFTQYNRSLAMTDLDHIQIFLNNDFEFPSCIVGVKSPEETLKKIYSENFNADYRWFHPQINGFRQTKSTEYEVVYCSSRPVIKNINKTGKFYTMYELISQKIEIESYYEQNLRSNNFLIV